MHLTNKYFALTPPQAFRELYTAYPTKVYFQNKADLS